MVKIEINGLEFFVKSNISVLEACKFIGILIPRFCYHELLSVAGNCRMCLVEVQNSPKPIASCALPILNNMKIFVNTPLVKKARENVLETLLLNHPLDCPICDQAGECDLQDQTKLFGSDYSRFFYLKRGVEDKNCGPLIKTIMTRCIHCTRCVRFTTEITGESSLGTLNRGKNTEIGNYIQKLISSEISGNVIDLCPVGALTSKPYAFKTRPWELKAIETIDLTDSLGSNVYISYKETEIMRVTPKINTYINGSLISDKARFSYDSELRNRLTKIYTFNPERKKFEVNSKANFLASFQTQYINSNNLFLVNEQLDFESLNKLKNLSFFKNIKSKLRAVPNNNGCETNTYTYNKYSKISELKSGRLCYLLGLNLKFENTLLNTKLRLKFNTELLETFNIIGSYHKSNFLTQFINLNSISIINILKGKNIFLSKIFLESVNPIILFSSNVITRNLKLNEIVNAFRKINSSLTILAIFKFSNSASFSYLNIKNVNTLDLKKAENIFLINLDSQLFLNKVLYNSFNKISYWVNTHGAILSNKCNTLIPIVSSMELEMSFLNLEERPQKTAKIFAPLHDALSLTSFISFLITEFGIKPKVEHSHQFLKNLIVLPNIFDTKKIRLSHTIMEPKFNFNLSSYPFKEQLEDFFKDSFKTKNSIIMNKCSIEQRKNSNNF